MMCSGVAGAVRLVVVGVVVMLSSSPDGIIAGSTHSSFDDASLVTMQPDGISAGVDHNSAASSLSKILTYVASLRGADAPGFPVCE